MKQQRLAIGPYKTVFKGLIFEIKQARAITPSGKVEIFERAKRRGSVAILAIDHRGRLILTREYRARYRRYFWRVPAGGINNGELPRSAAQRELREETGFRATSLKLFHYFHMSSTIDWDRYTFLATGLRYDPLTCDEAEDIQVVPTTLRKAFALVMDGKILNDSMNWIIIKLYYQRKKWLT